MSPRSSITLVYADEERACDAEHPCFACDDCDIARSLRRRDEPSEAEKAEREARFHAREHAPQVPEGFSLAERYARFVEEDTDDDW